MCVFFFPKKAAGPEVKDRDSDFGRQNPEKVQWAIRKMSKECVCEVALGNEQGHNVADQGGTQNKQTCCPREYLEPGIRETGCLGKDTEMGTASGVLGCSLWGWERGSWDLIRALSWGVSLHDHSLVFCSTPVPFTVQKASLHAILHSVK